MNFSVLARYLMTAAVSGAGLTCAVALVCPPSLAQQASMSGANTVSTPAGYVSSVSMETVLPTGFVFMGSPGSGNYVVTPTYSAPLTGASMAQTAFVGSMTLNGGTAPSTPTSQYSFEAAAAAALNQAAGGASNVNAPNWEAVSGIVNAGAGIDGF